MVEESSVVYLWNLSQINWWTSCQEYTHNSPPNLAA